MNSFHIFTYSLFSILSFAPKVGFAEDENKSETVEEENTGEIVVTGTRTEQNLEDSTVSVEVISAEALSNFGPGDLTDALQQLAGVNIERSILGSSPTLQGFAPKHTLVLINGQRLLGAKSGSIDLSRISITNIERIEIIRGAASVLYGSDAMGGVINIITKTAQDPLLLEGSYQHGTHGMIQADGRVGFQKKDLSYLLSANFRKGDGYDLDPNTEQTDGSTFQQLDLGYQNNLTLNEASKIESQVSYLLRDTERINSNGQAIYDQANRVEEAMLLIRPHWKPNEESKLSSTISASAYRDQYLQDQRHSVALDTFQVTNQRIGVLNMQYDHFVGGHLLTEGVEAQFEYIETERLKDQRANRERLAIYLQDQWNDIAGKDLHFISGVRLDLDSWFGFYPTPKFALRYDPIPEIRLRTVYGLGYRAPDFKELFLYFENPSVGYVVEGNPDLKPETSQSLQAEIEVYLPTFRLNVNLFRNDIEDLIVIASADSSTDGQVRWTYDNNAQAYTQGVEMRAAVQITPFFALNGNYNLIDSKDVTMDRPLEGRALHNGSAGFRLINLSTGSMLLANASFVGQRNFYFDSNSDGEEAVQSDPYIMLNLRFAQKINRLFEIFAGANNLLNEGDTNFLALQPRWFYGGIRGHFTKGAP